MANAGVQAKVTVAVEVKGEDRFGRDTHKVRSVGFEYECLRFKKKKKIRNDFQVV